jgi:hypothetical protein
MTNTNIKQIFTESGLVELKSHSITKDCADLLTDLYRAGTSLKLIPRSQSDVQVVSTAESYLAFDETAQKGLVLISDLISNSIATAAKSSRLVVASLYDIAKHLQSFHKLLSNSFIQRSIREVLGTQTLAMHKDSVGMRIDLPGEHMFLTNLHQEFHSYPFALNAAVLWIPLTRINRTHGTLAFYPRPHFCYPFPFESDISKQDSMLAEGRLQEAQKVGELIVTSAELGPTKSLDTEPGGCYIFSALLPHQSVMAKPESTLARLTCQARFFDLNDPFFAWKHQRGTPWSGLKRPSEAWELWKEWLHVQSD